MIKSQHHHDRYQRFIDALRNQVVDGYSELHHIVPRSLGGSDDASNLIRLTARQHFVAHWMLAKAFGGSAARAFFMMSNFGKYGKVLPKTYALAREEYAELVSEQMRGQVLPPVSEETRAKQSAAKVGRKLSAEHVEKVRLSRLGKKMSAEFCQKISKAKRGKPNGRSGFSMPEETKKKIGDAQRGTLNHMLGRKHSAETKEKMRLAHMKRNKPDEYLEWIAEGNAPLPAGE